MANEDSKAARVKGGKSGRILNRPSYMSLYNEAQEKLKETQAELRKMRQASKPNKLEAINEALKVGPKTAEAIEQIAANPSVRTPTLEPGYIHAINEAFTNSGHTGTLEQELLQARRELAYLQAQHVALLKMMIAGLESGLVKG